MARNFATGSINFDSINQGDTEGWTVAGWFRFETFGVDGVALVSYGKGKATASDRGFQLRLNGSASKQAVISVYIGGGVQNVTGTTALSANTWYHIAAVKDASGGTLRIYVNGTQEGSNTTDPPAIQTSGDDFIIGAPVPDDDLGLVDLDGDAEECAFWNEELSAAEVFALSRGVRSLKFRTASLRIYAPITGVHSTEPSFALATHTIGGTVTSATLSASNAPLEPLFSPYAPFAGAPTDAPGGTGFHTSCAQVMPRTVYSGSFGF